MGRTSIHYCEDRQTRESNIRRIGQGRVVDKFVVDRGHKNGAELHCITENAIILVYNQRTMKLVTKMIARPGQIRRYYENGDAPEYIIKAAREHVKQGLNN